MTVAVPDSSGALERYGEYEGLGLEDVKVSDLSVPRLSIIGRTAKIQHSVTKAEYDYLYVVLLAQVKQRIMWHKDVDDNYKSPQCKSTDFDHGFPNTDPKAPADRLFPWAESNFDPAAGVEGRYLPELSEEAGSPALPCESCRFKEWVNGKTQCKEQHSYPLLWVDPEDNSYNPAILTIQGSGIKNSRQYVQTFATKRRPLFTALTLIQLTAARKGTNDYAIPTFSNAQDTDPALFDEYAAQTRSMREFLRKPPRRREENTEEGAVTPAPAGNVNTGPVITVPAGVTPQILEPAAPPAPAPVAAVPPPAPVAVPAPAPVAAPVPVPAPAPAVAPAPAPVAPSPAPGPVATPPPPPPAPPVAAPVPVPVAAPAPPPPPAPAAVPAPPVAPAASVPVPPPPPVPQPAAPAAVAAPTTVSAAAPGANDLPF